MLPHLSSQLVATFVLLLSCLSQVISAAGAGLVRGVASFSGNLTQEWPLSGDIVISQRPEPGTSVTVSGSISGLPADQYVLLLVSLGPGYCDDMNRWVRMGDLRMWDQGPGEKVDLSFVPELDTDNISLDTDQLLGLVIRTCFITEAGPNCLQGETMGCAQVTWSPVSRSSLSWQIIIIIAAAVLLFFVLIIIIPLICCCIKRSKMRESSDTDVEDEYHDRSKSPAYDELSLPFIDASLPPTPKVGRIVNGLDILLGRAPSENSLVDRKVSQVQW